jgi:hypothetical protein
MRVEHYCVWEVVLSMVRHTKGCNVKGRVSLKLGIIIMLKHQARRIKLI